MNLIQDLHKKGLIKPPPHVIGGTEYITIMGSMAYGVSQDHSDMDIYGFSIPPKDMVFPHLRGEILDFGDQKQRFEQFQEHHVLDKSSGKEYDLNIYSIIKFFHLAMKNNPNMIDSLFTAENCVLHATRLARHVRDNRRKFLHKGSWHTFKGYAYSQMKFMKHKKPDESSKRFASVQQHGYDVKFAYHIVRLLNEVEQILIEHDIDLLRNNDQLKEIRAGEWTLIQIEKYFYDKEKSLEKTYAESILQHRPNEPEIKTLLLECLEEKYGSLDSILQTEDHYRELLRQIQQIVSKV